MSPMEFKLNFFDDAFRVSLVRSLLEYFLQTKEFHCILYVLPPLKEHSTCRPLLAVAVSESALGTLL
jgi:hypothetical protein